MSYRFLYIFAKQLLISKWSKIFLYISTNVTYLRCKVTANKRHGNNSSHKYSKNGMILRLQIYDKRVKIFDKQKFHSRCGKSLFPLHLARIPRACQVAWAAITVRLNAETTWNNRQTNKNGTAILIESPANSIRIGRPAKNSQAVAVA